MSKWDEILNTLESGYDLSHILINTWIKPLTIYKVEGKTVYFVVDEKFGQRGVDFIKNRSYDILLASAIREVLNDSSVEVIVTLASDFNTDKSQAAPTLKQDYSINKGNLNPKYTFDTFIVGESNKHAYATCIAVADSPGQDKFNPLFLYGGAGLGKTHLMQSIAHYIMENNRSMNVLYVPSNTFTNEIVEAIKKNKTQEFRDKYRTVDVLLIDDIQYLIGKESTQQEFFDTFNTLHDEGKQIILSSDKPPREIKTLDERYRSRFEWGVPIDIHAPDYETRMAILKNKVEMDHLDNIDEDILEYIADNITYNVRALEGALNKLSVFSELGKTHISLEKAKDILKDHISKEGTVSITPELIIDVVSEHTGISVDDIKSTKRTKDISNARQVAMYLCRKYTVNGLKTIGNFFGGKDHSTVMSNIKKVEQKLSEDSEFAAEIDAITKKISPSS